MKPEVVYPLFSLSIPTREENNCSYTEHAKYNLRSFRHVGPLRCKTSSVFCELCTICAPNQLQNLSLLSSIVEVRVLIDRSLLNILILRFNDNFLGSAILSGADRMSNLLYTHVVSQISLSWNQTFKGEKIVIFG